MDTKQTNTTSSQRSNLAARIVIFCVLLAIGFGMGWVRWPNSGDATSTGIVSQQNSGSADNSQSTSDQSSSKNQGGQSSKKNDKATGKDNQSSSAQSSNNGSQSGSTDSGNTSVAPERGPTVTEDGTYTSKDEVALYIHTYGHLPSNFIGKKKASDRGWIPSEGNLQEVCPGMSIGGSRYYNDDGQLPDKKGRMWTECDINYHGGTRGAERIVFSNDGLIYYTGDHYKTFEQLY